MLAAVEAEVRQQIDKRLTACGWVLDLAAPNQDVFVERAVVPRLSHTQQSRLGSLAPDYSLFCDGVAVGVIEAKKPRVPIREALAQGVKYAERLDVDFVFACNGPVFKSLHIPTDKPLRLNEHEVAEPLSPVLLQGFREVSAPELVTVPQTVITSREDLIEIFERLNNVMRQAGVRVGIDRFTEFANILFLKLASEQDEADTTWQDMRTKSADDLPNYLNGYVLEKLRSRYKNDVLAPTRINGMALKQLVVELNPLHLTSVDEDVKGVAFEHFLSRTTGGNDLGEYFTPRQVVRLAVKMLNPQFGETVYDPFCGTGGFLIEAFRHLGQQTRQTDAAAQVLQQESVFGTEITSTARIAKMNMILFGDGHSGVEQGDSLGHLKQIGAYDNVLSNIPFSLDVEPVSLCVVDPAVADADEACLLDCFNRLKEGGQLCVVVPEGLVVNRSHRAMWHRLCNESRIRAIMMLPRGTFAPYTTAGTRLLYLTDKGRGATDWYYQANLDGAKAGPSIGMDDFAFFYQATDEPLADVPVGVEVVTVDKRADPGEFSINRPARHGGEGMLPLQDIAGIRNGRTITEATANPGDVPVIAGGRGKIAYYHDQANVDGPSITISKSGAYAGYVWWHETSIWASDCLVIQSHDEAQYSSFYLYLCLRACQQELYGRQQGTGQPHVYREQVADFPIPDLSPAEQRHKIGEARSAIQEQLEAQAWADETTRDAVQSVGALYHPRGGSGPCGPPQAEPDKPPSGSCDAGGPGLVSLSLAVLGLVAAASVRDLHGTAPGSGVPGRGTGRQVTTNVRRRVTRREPETASRRCGGAAVGSGAGQSGRAGCRDHQDVGRCLAVLRCW